jgi:Na+-transporting NADH:ubiquinone oxidoreductase subunit NqrB
MSRFFKLQADPRHFQILYLSLFLAFGIAWLGWVRDLFQISALWLSALLTQIAFCHLYNKPYSALKSAVITALGLTLLLRAGDTWVYALAGFAAIASKFLIRYRGKHIFNPANFALILCVFLMKKAWVSPGQWGSDIILLFFIGAAGLMVLFRSARLDTAFTFLGVLFALEYGRNCLYLGWPTDFVLHRFSNGSLLLFSFFMITDPMTTPDHPKARMLWAAVIAAITFSLGSWMYLQTAPVLALALVSAATPLFDRVWKAQRFSWTLTSNKTSI